jgi:O-6-methylguanine DNA methyltransferase
MKLTAWDVSTPLGTMLSVFSPEGLTLLAFHDQSNLPFHLKQIEKDTGCQPVFKPTIATNNLQYQLDEFFHQQRTTFDIPLKMIGTPFQISVWKSLQQISYGETLYYQQQAGLLGNPKAIRAIASANGSNRISIIVPCHRVIGKQGKLVGFAGGIERKRALLALEHLHHLPLFSQTQENI